ncbi:conserved hypothetical protein [Chthoniobacter flavus Ellin428]|uniref:Uncharacterized protein n=1 Tax=Chthoniobacter flavus Ellin428 TaxID=497964 RepID=B4D4N8_9BACT|nr:hypothetical protein [Chthoniobacter flavus]EDY18491.1 conserved hypothetical protein [Chthoniobacter flavus Ellin428]TCO91047.1 hypothetical protein EV701_109201 [Chthoniobacter flavus]
MREYEIYLPTTDNAGQPVDEHIISETKAELTKAFGGYTHLRQRSEGVWRVGRATFRDEVTILRVIDDERTRFDWGKLKAKLERALSQESVLIVVRSIDVL